MLLCWHETRGQAWKLLSDEQFILYREHHLKERVITQASYRLQCTYQHVKGNCLMGISLKAGCANLVKQLLHCWITSKVRAQNQRIYKKTRCILQARLQTIRH